MSTLDAVIIGAIGMAALLFLMAITVVAVWKVFPLLLSLVEALVAVSKQSKGILTTLTAIERELAFMRGLAPPQQPVQVGGDPDEHPPAPGAAPAQPVGPTPYPSPVFDRFPVVVDPPDATVEDTDMRALTQDDADLVAVEQLENLRQMGIEVEPDNAEHEAIEVDSE